MPDDFDMNAFSNAINAPSATPDQGQSSDFNAQAFQNALNAPPAQETPSKPPKNVDYGTALQYGIANAVPFAHDLGAAIQAGETYLPKSFRPDDTGPEVASGTPFSQRMAAQKQRIEDTDRAAQAEYPVTSVVAPIAASVAALPFAGPTEAVASGVRGILPGSSSTVARGIGAGAVGAGYGALYGAGQGDTTDQRIANAEKGAAVGGVGGAIASPLAEGANWVGQRFFSSPKSAAADIISQKMAEDQGLPAPRLTAADIQPALSSGQPIAAVDLGGQNVRRLARAAANSSPSGDSVLSTLANERFEDQGVRLADFLHNLSGGNLNPVAARDALKQAGRAATGPAYAQAMAEGENGVWSPGLANLVQSPSIQQAMKGVASRAADDAVVNGNTIVKNPFVHDQQGNLVLNQAPGGGVAVPTLQYWDYVKRGLDDQIGAAYRSGQDDTGRNLVGLKNKLLGELDSAAPSYAAARKTAFDAFGASDALEAGENFLRMAPTAQTGQMKAALSQMTPQQRDIFGQGLASQMAQTALNTNSRRNVINMFNSPEMAQRLQMGLGPQRANQVEAFLRRESIMDMLRPAITGNSSTAKQSADILTHGFLGALAKGATNPLVGAGVGGYGAYEENGFDPLAIAKGAAVGAGTGLAGRYLMGRRSAVMGEIANQLASHDPAAINAATNKIASTPPLMAALRRAEQGMTLAAARRQGLPSPGNLPIRLPSSQPAYAKGGKVKKPTHEFLVNRLMALAEKAKRAEKKSTAPILNMPDDTVTAALAKAQEAI